MEFQTQNNFEEEWRKAFENASAPPSDELWGRIEAELEKKKRPFLFFLKPSLIATGLAAALVLVLGSILFLNKETNKGVAQHIQKPAQTQASTVVTEAPNSDPQTDETQPLALAKSLSEIKSNEAHPKVSVNPTSVYSNSTSIASTGFSKPDRNTTNSTTIADKPAIAISDHSMPDSGVGVDAPSITATKILLANIDNLESKKYRYFGSRYTLNRNKLVFDSEATENTDNTALASNDSKFWIGLQSGVAPFDPNMKFGSLNTLAYSSANEYAQNSSIGGPNDKGSMVSKPQNDIRAGLAINSGMAVGLKIAKKWHIESGVRYLRGNSTLKTNTYAFQNNGYVNTFLGNYLLQNSTKDYSFLSNSSTVVADASEFGNRYEYLMVPMQVGYEIGLTNKLGLNILAGFSTDIFLQNSIFTDNGLVRGKNTISNESKIYKPVNFSGLGGLRASYLISKHWQANIGTSYQRALFSGTSSSIDLNMKLQMFGINYGFNYRF